MATGAPIPSQILPVEQFVRQTYIHGLPYLEANKYDSTAIPILTRMLRDRAEEEHWANVVGTLGAIGNQQVFLELTTFLARGTGLVSAREYDAKSAVLIALGYLSHRSGDDTVLTYLIESADPRAWERRQLAWGSPFHDSIRARDEQLSTMAVIALGLSGRERAREALVELQEDTDPAIEEFSRRIDDVTRDALQTWAVVSDIGLEGYYREYEE